MRYQRRRISHLTNQLKLAQTGGQQGVGFGKGGASLSFIMDWGLILFTNVLYGECG